MTRVVVIGGGAGGLSCALSLLDAYRARGGQISRTPASDPQSRAPGLSVYVLEAREGLGGRVGSEHHGSFVIETGAATVQESAPGLRALIDRLGIADEVVYSDEKAARRYVYRQGRLRRLPMRPPELLSSDAFSVAARARLLLEPLIPARPPAVTDESIEAFFTRRIGPRMTAEIVEPALAGIYAGDIAELSMPSALPRVWQMEAEHGSLLKALRKSQATQKSQASSAAGGKPVPGSATRLFGLRGGLGQLMGALGRAIESAGGIVRPLSAVKAITLLEDASSRYRLRLRDGQIDADRLVLAVPPPEAARLLTPLDAPLGELYAGIKMAPIVAISLGWPREQVPHPLDGFGFLVPRGERMRDGLRLLGALFMTSALPDFEQAPKGQVVIRAMYGGAHDPEVEQMADGALLEQVQRDLRTTLGIWAEPRFIHIQRWPQAIEQYRLGHAARVADIEARLAQLGPIYATGAALRGVSVPDVLRAGSELGQRLASELPLD